MVGIARVCHFVQALTLVSFSFAIPMWMCETYAQKNISIIIHSSFVVGKSTLVEIRVPFSPFINLCLSGPQKKIVYGSLILFPNVTGFQRFYSCF